MKDNLNINKELEVLILKYKIDAGVYHFQYHIAEMINKIFDSFGEEKCVALRGGGEHADKLLQVLSEANRKKVKYVIDRNKTIEGFHGIEVIDIKNIPNRTIDIFIISSFKHRVEMARELFTLKHCLNEDFQVIDLYEILQQKGIACLQPFYSSPVYGENLYVLRQCYMQSSTQLDAEILLSKIIAAYLEIKDFINAKKYIDEYTKKGYEKSYLYKEFWSEFECLLEKINHSLKLRKQRDIVWNWIDALCYGEIETLNYLKNLKASSLFFENAYRVMGATNMSMAMIMTNQLVIDDKLYALKKYDNKVLLLEYLENNGYAFHYIGGHTSTLKKLADEYKRYSLFLGNFYETSCSQLQWEAWDALIQSDKPVCVCIHNSVETHRPFWGNNNRSFLSIEEHETGNYKESSIEQYKDAKKYLNEQLEWYQKAYSEFSVNIFMSDHGKVDHYLGYDDSLGTWHEKIGHILMMISGKDIKSEKVTRLYQGNKLYYIIRYIIEGGNYEEALSDYVLTQDLDIYNDKFIDKLIEQEGDGIIRRIQCRGCYTSTEFYNQYADGREEYVNCDIGMENLANNPQYRERMDELKEKAGSYFINVFEDDFFVAARKLYNIFGLVYCDGRYIKEKE
ncbi:MAG: hypothetical protein J6D02_12955 [Lachnospira sp.]|nr:hypothetical protein [Lachnospira sp.]